MYRWRQFDARQRREVLEYRKQNRLPWHSPPHYTSDTPLYMITAACYEHRHIIGHCPQRMADFETELLDTANNACRKIFAWVVLPNHYHLLADTLQVKQLLHNLGQLHGRTSYRWNGEEDRRGRKVWHNAAETAMKSERHFWATLNYVLNNAVHHGYVERWQDWPYSNAETYLAETGRKTAEQIWRDYPVLDYGKDWDPPEL